VTVPKDSEYPRDQLRDHREAGEETSMRLELREDAWAATKDVDDKQSAESNRAQSAESNQVSKCRILAVASAGGHWVQLQRVFPAFKEHNVAFLTTDAGYRSEALPHRFYVVNDASSWSSRLKLAQMAVRILLVVVRERPSIVISTGAACGFFSVLFGKMIGARTIWIDSIANIDELSMAGRLARRYADLWLTQWPHLASAEGPFYAGTVL
jgi:exopolysaccharide biosynthesis glucuronosyltransferase PssD